MSDQDYGASNINWLRGPDVEGETGAWKSTWVLRLASPPTQATDLERASRGASWLRRAVQTATITLTGEGDDTVILALTSALHPLEPDCFPLVDDLLLGLDAVLGGILDINGSPRDQWRTFRIGRAE